MNYSNKLEFLYNKQSLADSLQRTNAVALNPLDTTQAYTLDGSTRVWVVLDGKGSYGSVNLFYVSRNIANSTPTNVIVSLLCDYGNLSFTLVLPNVYPEKGKIYESYCSYRDGIFTSSISPKVTFVILDNPDETRLFTVYF